MDSAQSELCYGTKRRLSPISENNTLTKKREVNQLLGKNDYALVENTINKSNKGFRVQTNYYVGYEKIAVAYNDYFASCAL